MRDLGGRKAGGKVIKNGLLLRAGSLQNAADEALGLLKSRYRLQSLIDLRMSSELGQAKDPAVKGAENCHIPVMELEDFGLPAGMQDSFMFTSTADRMKFFDSIYETGMAGPKLYAAFLLPERGRAAYRELFRLLLEAEEGRAVLWHCTDGKDRTGCAAMLVLFALGADYETALEDYMLTNEVNAERLAGVRKYAENAGFSGDRLELLLFLSGGVSKERFDAAINAMSKAYGSVEGYLTGGLGLSGEELSALRKKYLE